MYACVFFEEDSSLSVVWREDQDLSLIEDFKEHHKVEMKLLLRYGTPKILYHGTIVKVSEGKFNIINVLLLEIPKSSWKPYKAYLDTFANKAYTAIIKGKLPVQGDNQSPPEELFTFESGNNVKGKRKRTKTDKVVQSEKQDEEFIPKNKKKNKVEKEKQDEELSQKKKKRDKVEKEKKRQFSVDDSNSNQEAEKEPTQVPDVPTALSSDVVGHNNVDVQPNIMLPVPVDITSTWKVCTNAMDAVCDEIPTHVASSDATVTNTCVIQESHDILVDKLRKAISAAKKSQKVGYTLCYKLLSSMFSVPEMANSRGQGIGTKKEGDFRQPLKRETVNTLKDYVIVWCKKNSYTTPTEQLLNDTITEMISYARKQIKTPSKKL
ncbi:uncharacterized protein LOC127732362 [Mytilus californianus]|uniref:uncharacterized protein LOC127732362 n=1 Tax=Mytilus californianus TaxID=6549 RepID=UPI00224856A6|nr:uncharacterized protein LOC127732362 [Mytilus californianus]